MTLTIGKLATAANVNLQTVRYYKRRGLFPAGRRTAAEYRHYTPDEIARLRFIKHAHARGCSLQEVAELLALRVRHGAASATIERKTRGSPKRAARAMGDVFGDAVRSRNDAGRGEKEPLGALGMPRCAAVIRALTVAGMFGIATAAGAQGYPFSQRGSVSQTVAFTDISVTYGRPVARGRVLFGQLVPWDSVWHPGADSATRISFSHDVLLEGHEVKAGEYSLWLVPRERQPWTLILSRAAHAFHKPYPGPADDALRVDIAPERGTHMEALAIYFPVVLRDETTMRVHWGETMLAVRLRAPFRPE